MTTTTMMMMMMTRKGTKMRLMKRRKRVEVSGLYRSLARMPLAERSLKFMRNRMMMTTMMMRMMTRMREVCNLF